MILSLAICVVRYPRGNDPRNCAPNTRTNELKFNFFALLLRRPVRAFCLACLSHEHRDAPTGSRPLLRLGLYLNSGAPLTTTSTSMSTHRERRCVDRTSRRKNERIGKKYIHREKYHRLKKKNLRFCEMKTSLRHVIYWRTGKICGDV